MEDLERALEAHFRDFDVLVQLKHVDKSLENFDEQVAEARRGVSDIGAHSVIWFDWEKGLVYVMVLDRTTEPDGAATEHLLDRPLPRSEEGEVVIDAVASLVRSVLYEWLERGGDATEVEVVTEREPEDDKAVEQTDTVTAEKKTALSHLSYYVAGGYIHLLASFADTTQHGGTLRFGMMLTPHVEVGIGLDLLGFIRLSSSTDTIALSRWPLRLRLLGIWPLGKFELGLETSLLVTFSRIHGLADEDVVSEITRVDPAFATSLMVRYQLFDRLSAWAEVGVDVYGARVEYMMNDEIMIQLSPVQLRFAVGLAVVFGVY